MVASRHWQTWCIPLVPLRCAKGFGYKLIARLLPCAFVPSAGCNSGSGGAQALAQFSPDALLEIADSMRLLLPVSGSSMLQHQRQDLCQRVDWLQSLRDSLVAEEVRRSRSVFDLKFLINCILTALFLKNANSLREALVAVVDMVIPDASLAEYFKQLLESPVGVPSPRPV